MGWITNIMGIGCIGFGLVAVIAYPEQTLNLVMKLSGLGLRGLEWAITDGLDLGLGLLGKIVSAIGKIIGVIDTATG